MLKIIIIFKISFLTSFLIYSQTFDTTFIGITDMYHTATNIFESENTFHFFYLELPYNLYDTGNYNSTIKFKKLDNLGNVIIDTTLFPNATVYDAYFIKSKSNDYYLFTNNVSKTDAMNGKIIKMDTSFNILAEKNLPLMGDSTFGYPFIMEDESNNMIFLWEQVNDDSTYSTPWKTFIYKTDANLDSLNYNSFSSFSSLKIFNDTLNHCYIATPSFPTDTVFIFFNYNLDIDTVWCFNHTIMIESWITKFQNDLLLLSNNKKIYSSTSVQGFKNNNHYMGIYLFLDKYLHVGSYHQIDSLESPYPDAYPAPYHSLSYVKNSPYIYFVGSNGYGAGFLYEDDTNSVIVCKMDTNLHIEFIKYFHHSMMHIPYTAKATNDGGVIIVGLTYYRDSINNLIAGNFVLKLDSLGNLTWSHGIDVQEDVALVYPNPAKDVLYVQNGLMKQKANFTLFDIAGKQVFKKPLQPFENNYNISELPSGVYIYRIASKDKLWQRGKIVKE